MTRWSRREIESAIERIKAESGGVRDGVDLPEDVRQSIVKMLKCKYGLEDTGEGDPVDQLTDDERERLGDWMAERRAEQEAEGEAAEAETDAAAETDADAAADGGGDETHE